MMRFTTIVRRAREELPRPPLTHSGQWKKGQSGNLKGRPPGSGHNTDNQKHLVIPDTQVKPGVSVDHMVWIGRYIKEKQPDTVIHIGDHWDMPSLSSYDKGKKSFEGRTYRADIDAGNAALETLTNEIAKGRFKPRLVILRGNHENRIERAIEDQRELENAIGYQDFNDTALGWEAVPFLKQIEIDGILYCHFFPQGPRGTVTQTRRGAPNADAQLARIGQSCSAGHMQGLSMSNREFNGKLQWGLIAGSCYQHDEAYMSPMGQGHWRGIIVKHQVTNGSYSPMVVDLSYLKKTFGARDSAGRWAAKS